MQTYSGFDPKFEDVPGYILGITSEIWEERNIDAIRRYYGPKVAVRSPAGVVVGNEDVVAATLATLAEFPDRQLLGEDVIWHGDETGFLSSHRLMSTATHTADGVYGRHRGGRVRYRAIADCAVKENQVYDEWLVRDQGAIVRQLGVDPKDYAADQILAEGGPAGAARPFHPDRDERPSYEGRGNDEEHGAAYAALLVDIMAGRLSAIDTTYDRAVNLELPGGRSGYGRADADEFWLGLRSALPDATFAIDHQIGRTDPDRGWRAALRWSLDGFHHGWGMFGRPTGARLHVMGFGHAEFGPEGIRREFVLLDETAIWRQILLHTG